MQMIFTGQIFDISFVGEVSEILFSIEITKHLHSKYSSFKHEFFMNKFYHIWPSFNFISLTCPIRLYIYIYGKAIVWHTPFSWLVHVLITNTLNTMLSRKETYFKMKLEKIIYSCDYKFFFTIMGTCILVLDGFY